MEGMSIRPAVMQGGPTTEFQLGGQNMPFCLLFPAPLTVSWLLQVSGKVKKQSALPILDL